MNPSDPVRRREHIEQLRARVEARQLQKAREQRLQYVTNFLSAIPSLAFLGFLEEPRAVVEPWPAYMYLNRYDEAATSLLSNETSSSSEERQWFEDCLARANMSERMYLSLDGFMSLPWAEVQVINPVEGLYPIWKDPSSRELAVLSHNQQWIVVFIEVEHNYEARIREMSELLPKIAENDPARDGMAENFNAKIYRFKLM